MKHSPERDRARLLDILSYIEKALALALPGERDEKTYLAATRCLEIIGEAANHLSPDAKASMQEIPWHEIRGMRNILVHDYLGTSPQDVWETILVDLPKLKKTIYLYLHP